MKMNNMVLTKEEGMKYFEDIVGYDYVKTQMTECLNLYRYLESSVDNDINKAGVAFIGPKGSGKKYMAENYARQLNRSIMVFDAETSLTVDQCNSYFSEIEKAIAGKKVSFVDRATLLIANVDMATPEVLSVILRFMSKVCKDFYTIVTLTDQESVCAQQCINEWTPFIIAVNEPGEKDSMAFLEYLVKYKYKDTVFKTAMDDLLNIFMGIPFWKVDQVLNRIVLKAACSNEDVGTDSIVFGSIIKKKTSYIQYPLDKRIKAGVHEAGHILMEAKLREKAKGFSFLIGLEGVCWCRESYEYDGLFDEELPVKRMLALLAGMAADELCSGSKSNGSSLDIKSVKELILEDLTKKGIHGLEYIEIAGGEDYKEIIDRKAHEILEELYQRTLSILAPYKELLFKIGEKIGREGYILLPEVRRLLAEFDKNRG